MHGYNLLLVCGIGLNVVLCGGVIWLLRQFRREIERDLQRLIWPLVDTVLTLRDAEEEDRR